MTVTKNIYLNNITESVYTYSTGISSGGTFSHDYSANGSTVLLTGTIGGTFTCAISNVPTLIPTSSYGRACVVTLIMNNSPSTYCNAVTVNGTSATVYFNGGSSSISISSASVVVQQLAIYYASLTYYVLSNVSSFKT